MITIEVKKRTITLSRHEAAVATDANARDSMKYELEKILDRQPAYKSADPLVEHEITLGRMVNKYSEQLVYKPLSEIRYWFTYSAGAFIDPGYPPLYYARTKGKRVSPNKSAIAGIGEGVAGLLLQRVYRARKITRPNHDYPDIIMDDRRATLLVEAKAMLPTGSNPKRIATVLNDELPRFVTHLIASSILDSRQIVGVLVGTEIWEMSSYAAYITEVRLS